VIDLEARGVGVMGKDVQFEKGLNSATIYLRDF
jgi:hypothetical protein